MSSKGLISIAFILGFTRAGLAQVVNEDLLSKKPEFSHQYKYLGQEYYQFIDTSFNSLKWYHQLNNTFQNDYGYSVLTNMGGACNSLLLPVAREYWNLQGLGPYRKHFNEENNIPFYFTKSPLTEANYVQGYNRGQSFSIHHTQNVHKRWNFLVRYKRLNSLGFYTHNQNKQSNFLANTHYQSPNGDYKAHAYVISEKLEIQEFGGLANDSVFEENDETSRELLQTNLRQDQRIIRNREVYLKQDFRIFGLTRKSDTNQTTEESALSFGHEFKYTRRSQVYNGFSTDFYDNYYLTDGAYTDSMAYHAFNNYAYLETDIGDSSRLNIKAGIKNITYRYVNENFNFQNSSWGIAGNIKGRIADLLDVTGQIDYAFTGALANTFNLSAEGELELLDWLKAFGGYRYALQYPELYQQLYFSNNFIWQNNFDPYSLGVLHYGVKWPWEGQIQIKNFNATKWVYFNADAQPEVAGTSIKYTQIDLNQNFTFWNFLHLDNRITYQVASSGAEYLPLPEWVTRNALYFEFDLIKGALQCLVGSELNYFSAYSSPSYSSAVGRFYVADNKVIGDYPYIDLFAQFKVLKAMIFLKYQHVNQGLTGFDYYAAPGYPLNDRVFRVGITWRFFN